MPLGRDSRTRNWARGGGTVVVVRMMVALHDVAEHSRGIPPTKTDPKFVRSGLCKKNKSNKLNFIMKV